MAKAVILCGMTSKPFVTKIDIALAEKIKQGLEDQGFILSVPEHTLFSGKKAGVSCTLYRSGKLVVMGKEMEPFIRYWLEPEILHTFTYGYELQEEHDLTPRIGVDESGKGVFFGPLCIAGVYAAKETVPALKQLGVRDSKSISDKAASSIAQKIRAQYTHHVICINPLKYNELYLKFGNLNTFLAWGHAAVIEELATKSGCRTILIDQFAAPHVVERALQQKNLDLHLTQRHRAEEDLVVAAASILARDAFLAGLTRLSEQISITLPKGASPQVKQVGRQIIAKHGPEMLRKVAKVHFKTYEEILRDLRK